MIHTSPVSPVSWWTTVDVRCEAPGIAGKSTTGVTVKSAGALSVTSGRARYRSGVATSASWSQSCVALFTYSSTVSYGAQIGLLMVSVTSTVPPVMPSPSQTRVDSPMPRPAFASPLDAQVASALTVTKGALVPITRPSTTLAASVSACAASSPGSVTADAT